MIRLFIFVLIRFFIASFVIYLVLTILGKILRSLRGHSQSSPPASRQESQPKPTENYKDVKEAKFTELPNKQTEDTQDSPP